ncbi:MAG: FAD synthetase family protein [Treponemataceae bacterium]|nr:FAD synthetase family protein [Treponemataceae bacterium]
MEIFHWKQLDLLKKYIDESGKKSAVTVGGFDGPHFGHMELMKNVLSQANCLKGIVTFNFTQTYISFKKNFRGELSTVKLKMKTFEKLGFDYCLLIDFSSDFSKIKGYDFLDLLRESCSMQFLAVGSDFRCGYNLDTGVAELSDYVKRFGLELKVCDQVLFEGKRISSSEIRQAVMEGDFSLANKLLVFPYSLDSSLFDWKPDVQINSSVNQKVIIANKTSFQIIPKSGEYTVSVSCFDRDFNSKLYVESDFLRLEIPLEQEESKIEMITFN